MNQEASEGLGFSDRGLGKAYQAGRNRIGEYKLYTTLKKFAVSLLVFIFPKIYWREYSGVRFPRLRNHLAIDLPIQF